MKIGWASPINSRSAIGRVSADVTRALVERGHQVEVIATEMDADLGETYPTPAAIVPWRAVDHHRLAAYDILIAQVGDHYLFHGGMFPFLGHVPTLGVFHDFYLFNLFNGWAWTAGGGDDAIISRHDGGVAEIYGEDLRDFAQAIRRGEVPLEEIAARTPMTEWVARRCHGALAHGGYYVPRLAAACAGPVDRAFMPVTSRGVAPLRQRKRQDITLLTVGVMNPNKCVDRMIQAIGSSDELKARVAYRLVGPITPAEQERLSAVAQDVGYVGLTIVGAVDDEELPRHLQDADVISCLRKPVLEGSSGSAIEALLAGRPTIFADAGFYAELPDDCTFKVGADLPVDQLAAQLRRLLNDEPLRRRAGKQARDWAAERFSMDPYVDAVERMAQETIDAYPVLRVGERLGRELSFLGLDRGDPVVDRIGSVLNALLPTA